MGPSGALGGGRGQSDPGPAIKDPDTLPKKVATIAALLLVSRLGSYIPLPGIDREAFRELVQGDGANSFLQYVDRISGGSISNFGLFTLGIVPVINASIVMQLLGSAIPGLKALQKDEGEAGRRQFNQYSRYAAVVFATVQAVGLSSYIRAYAYDFDTAFLASTSASLVAGSMFLMWIGELITAEGLSNGTSLLIFVSIISSIPASFAQTIDQAQNSADGGTASIAAFVLAFLAIVTGVVCVQEAERRLPMVYSNQRTGGMNNPDMEANTYLPLKVNTSGVMPIIFASTLMSAPLQISALAQSEAGRKLVALFVPGSAAYMPLTVVLIAFFNYFYTFVMLDPAEVATNLKKQGASLPGKRPGNQTSDYISNVLVKLTIAGSIFLGGLAITPALVEKVSGLDSFRGFAGTSVLILVGVATDVSRKVKGQSAMDAYKKEGLELDKTEL